MLSLSILHRGVTISRQLSAVSPHFLVYAHRHFPTSLPPRSPPPPLFLSFPLNSRYRSLSLSWRLLFRRRRCFLCSRHCQRRCVCVCVISMLGGHRGFHFRHYCPSSKLLPAFPQGVAITSLCFAARGNRVLLSYTAPDLEDSVVRPPSVVRGASTVLVSWVQSTSDCTSTEAEYSFGRPPTQARPRDGAASISADSSIQLGEGGGFEPSTFRLLAVSPNPLHQLSAPLPKKV